MIGNWSTMESVKKTFNCVDQKIFEDDNHEDDDADREDDDQSLHRN